MCCRFADMLTFLMRDVQPHDRVRISLMNEALHHEVYVPFMSPDDLTVERIFQEVERILQSSSEWLEKDNICTCQNTRGRRKSKLWQVE